MKRFLQLICITIVITFSYHSGTAQILRPVNDTTICVGESVILEAQAGSYMYNWSTGQLAPTISVSPVVTTTYDLRVFIPDTGIELITNGDFELGNVGFYSEYIYCPDPVLSTANHSDSQSLWMEGRYAVDVNPQAYHANFSSCIGQTGNTPDKMLIVNGAPDENVVVWSQTITVTPNQYYAFSTWAANVHPTNPARLEFMIDGVLMGDYIEPGVNLTCNWEEFYSLWYSGTNTSIEISIVNKNLIRSGNDYALDGISFNPLVEVPDSRTVTVNEPAIIDAGSDLTICGNETASLGAIVSNQTGFVWSTSGDGTFSNPSNVNSTYTPGSIDATNGSVILTATANSNAPCGVVSDFMTLNLNPVPFIGFGDNQASCGGGNVTLDAGNSGSSYSWNTGETSQTIEISTNGTYSVEVINSFGCVETDTVYVGFYANLTIDLGPDRTVCSGSPVVLNAGISGATYLWNTGETTQEIIVYSGGNYSVTVTNSYGCNATDDVNVTLLPPPVVDLGPDQELIPGDLIRLDAGVQFWYLWDNGYWGRYLDINKPGLYAVRVFDSNGCSAMDMVNISSTAGVVPDVTLNDTIICRGESVELFAGDGFLFNWDVDGLSSRVVVAPDSTTTYNLRVFYIDQTLELVNNGDFTLGNIGFQSSYFYCPNPGNKECNSYKSKYTISSNTTVLGGGFNDCSGVTGNFPDNVMVVKGAEANNTVWEQTISVDPNSYYVFAVNIANLHSNSYDEFEVKVNGVAVDHFYTDEPCDWDVFKSLIYSDVSTELHISIDNVSTSGVGNGYALDGISMFKLSELPLDVTVEVIQHVTADAGADLAICESGTAGLNGVVSNESSFIWRTLGDGTFDNTWILNPIYTPGSADKLNGFVDIELSAQPIIPCVDPAKDTVRVNINSNLNVDLGADQAICQGNTLILDAGNIGSTYLWNTGETTQTITVNAGGNYSVVVTDVNGCSGTDDIDITVHVNPIVDLGVDQEECNGNTIMLEAGHPGSTYLWSTGETLQAILVSTSGNYSVVMTDINGCIGTDDANAIIHANPVVDLGIDQETCAGNSITFDAGNVGGNYLWSTGVTTQTISVSTSGNYSVTITDANGCSATDDANATIHANPVVDLGIDQETCAGNSITFDAGNVGSTYLWSTGVTTQTISVSTSGNYSVVITDGNGCSATDDAYATIHANPAVDLGIDQETCAGNSITFDAGNVGSTYLWSTGETTQTISVSTSGNYSVTITDANGCSATDDVDATIHANPVVDLGIDQETCAGNSITFDAGNVGSTYLWSTGETTQTITVSTSGNYSVTITDANGCTATDVVNANIHANPVVDLGIDQETCAGNGITFDAGNVGSTYLWSTGETTQTITVSTSGNYSVTITDANGCSATDAANATIHANPVVDLGIDQETCAGNSITFDAGNVGGNYLWSTGVTTQTISVSTSGNYSVTITDANGCSATDDANATIHANPVVDLGIDQETCAGNSITFDAGNVGSTYLWSTGVTTQTISVSTSGNYSVVITDGNGCSATDDAYATIHANPAVDLGIDQETCAGNSITFDAGNVGSTYLWSTGETTQTISVSTSGNYSVTITDANGCSATDDVDATIHANPVVDLGIDQETCAGNSITFDAGNVGSTYLWSTGETTQTITVSTSGNYSVTITDANGCSATDAANATIHVNPVVDLGIDQETCAGNSITFDAGNVGSTYLWSTGETTQTISVSTSGNYSVTITDANGCSATDDVDATIHANPVVDLGIDQETCAGNGITFDAGNVGSTYLWSTGETTQTITVSTSGNYSVTITDANGCSATDAANATIHANPVVDLGIDQETCAGNSITFDAGNVGGNYLWSTGVTTQTISVSTSGNYSVTITDANGCSATDDANATIHANPVVDLGIDQETCAGNSITFDAGNVGSTYLWSTGETTQTISVSTSGNYSVTITDANGCSATDDVDATIHANPVVDLGIDQETCAGNSITFDAGNVGSTYLWSTGETTQTISVSTSGNYSVTITDANGCSATDDVDATIHANPVVDLGIDQETCAGNSITFDAGNVGGNYLWSTGATTQTISVSASGNYSVTITDANGCSATDNANATIHANPVVDLGIDQETCAGNSITFDAGNIGSTYLWSTGETTQTITVSTSGNYSVTITDANGCTATDVVNANIHANPVVDLGIDQETCAGNGITFDAGNVGSTYLWSTGETTQTITVSTSGNYSVTITDANGCSATDAANATIHANPVVDLGIDQETCAGNSITFDAGNVGGNYLWSTGVTTQTISVSTSGNYSVTITDANGCSATDDANATIHANPVVDLGIDQETCAGNSITFDAGNVGSTYLWSTGVTTQTISVSTSGNYSVVITDGNGCSATDDAYATIHANPAVDLGIDQETCAGNSITFDAGNVGSTYLWSTGETTQTISVSTSGNYSVTITDANGCSATDDVDATIHANPVVDLGIDQETCAGNSITFDAGNVGSTYLWSTGETTQTITVSTSGNYSVTITDANGCTATDVVNANIHANPVVDLGIDQETCAGNGITFDAGNVGSTYLWSTGETTQTITVSTSGNYSVTITDANGCSATDAANATIHANPVVDLGIDQETCAGNSITFDAGNVGGNYLWSTGVTTQTISVSTSGNYSVTITDANGCSATDDANATIHANPVVDLGIDQETCAGNSITFDAGNVGSTYLWSTGVTTQTISVSTSGNYSVVITDGNGCSATDDAYATIHANPAVDLGIDQETCAGNSITFDAGNVGSTYLWSTGETTQTISVSTSGNYSVTITDANGCSATDDVDATIHANPVVDLGIDQETCAGNSITFDAGNVGSTYLWSTGVTTQTISVSTSGNYSVVITDGNGCSATDDAYATIHANPAVDLGIDQETCAGNSITFDAGNVGSTYLWSTGETTQTISVSTSGNYSVTITDANGCSATDDVDATIHANPVVDLGIDQETCAGNSITFDAGNVGSTYLWSTGETTQTITVSTSGNYSVTITDANGCSATDDVDATIHANPVVDLGIDQETCAGNSITFDAGNVGSTYLWSTGETTQTITVSTSGNYSVTITDANGCTATDVVNANIHANPVVDLGIDQETCAGNGITFDAGNVGSTYLWSTGETTQTISVSTSGNYSVTITDANGCSATDDVDATIHANPVVDLGIDQETCAGNSITFDAGNVGSTYLWSTGATTQTISVSTSGNYSVTITDANGCSATDAANATIHANPVVDLGIDQETCAGNSITFDAGNVGSTYLWSTGATTQTISVSTSGNYSVTITDANGCSATDNANATIHANPVVDLGIDQSTCAGNSITFDAGNIGSTYLWNTGATTQTITVSTSGNYSVTITDANGCSATDNANATIYANPLVDLGIDQETCAGSSITFDAGNVGSTYLWNTGETTQTIAVSTSGVYSVTVTNANGCSATDAANATIHANPVVDSGIDQETCAGNSITFDAGNVGSTYLWSTGETTQTISVSTSGNYSVTITDANGCSATDAANATIHSNPMFNLSYSNNLVCHGDSTYIEGPIQTGYIYQWKKDGSELIGETNYSITVGETGWYILEIQNGNACPASDSVYVEIIHLPNNPLPNQIEMCFGESVLLDIGDGESFLWSDGVTSQTRLANTGGVYSVEVKDLNGCIGYDSVNVILHDLPIVDLGPDLYICRGEELIIEAPEGYHSEWIPGGQTKEIYVYEAGEFTLKATDDFGCVGHDEIKIFVHDNPSVYLGRDTVIGEGTTIILDAGSGYVQYEWSNQENSQFLKVNRDGEYAVNVVDMNGCRGNGKVKIAVNPVPSINLGGSAGICEGTSLMLDPGRWERYLWSTGATTRTINVNKTGDYIVSVWDVYGIMGIDTLHVEVYPSPELSLSRDTLSFYKGQTVTIDAGSGYSSYYWSTGSDWRSIEVDEPGDYTVQVMNDFGCLAQSAAAVKLLQPKMVVPNVFTPNGKGPNEIFYPVFKGAVTDFELYIYSRWGEQVFELRRDVVANNELKYDGWNGTYKGVESEIGVYVWIIFYGGKERAHGTVTLFR